MPADPLPALRQALQGKDQAEQTYRRALQACFDARIPDAQLAQEIGVSRVWVWKLRTQGFGPASR